MSTKPAPPAGMTAASPTDLSDRLRRARTAAGDAGIDALLITPGAGLRYLTGYAGDQTTERLTCLVASSSGAARLLVPELEVPLARATMPASTDVEVVSWSETDDPFSLLVGLLPADAPRLAVDDQMWAARVLELGGRLPRAELRTAGPILAALRLRKTPAEIDSLRRAGAAIDEVHARVAGLLRPGRSEREVARDITEAIVDAGHERADFVIVASGPNGASPHAGASDRVIEPGDPVVVDIGGPMPDGYYSDCTRTYAAGRPPAAFEELYAVLLDAQRAQCAAAVPGITAAELDGVGRSRITSAGFGSYFIHRTGHGIGLEVHEPPYIVAGNDLVLEEGMAFSIEPGIYLEGRFGARIEDIVVCAPRGGERLNRRPRELLVVEG